MIDVVVSFKHHMTGEALAIMDIGAPCPGHNLNFSNCYSGAIGHTEKSTCAKYEVYFRNCGLTDVAHATYKEEKRTFFQSSTFTWREQVPLR